MVGYYHVVNRGVEQRIVYKDDEDFETFMELLCSGCSLYGIKLHDYVLMSNHYHLLIETTKENLSAYMKYLNASYAIYFNKKYKRSGHLWQGRFKSWYVTDEAYLYTLISYIEHNPVKAGMVQRVGDYHYSAYSAFIEEATPIQCLRESIMFTDFANPQERIAFFESTEYEHLLDEIKKASNLVVTHVKEKKPDPKRLEAMFSNIRETGERNQQILRAYDEGYSQHAIAMYLGFTQPYIHKIIKSLREKQL